MFGSRSQFSNWKEISVYVLIIALLIGGICFLQPLFIPAGVLLLIVVVWFARRAYTKKKQILSDYLDDVIRNIERSVHYSTKNLDVGVAVFSSDGRLQWKNEKFQEWTGLKTLEKKKPEEVLPLPENAFETMCVKDDTKIIKMRGRYYKMRYFSVQNPAKTADGKETGTAVANTLMIYLTDVTEWEQLKQRFAEERMCLAHVRFDNYEDVMKGLGESARANLNGEIGQILNKWVESLRGFVVRANNENLVVGINYKNLQKAMEDKFSILDRVREVRLENKLAPTISIGISMRPRRWILPWAGAETRSWWNVINRCSISAGPMRSAPKVPGYGPGSWPTTSGNRWKPRTKCLSWAMPMKITMPSAAPSVWPSWPFPGTNRPLLWSATAVRPCRN